MPAQLKLFLKLFSSIFSHVPEDLLCVGLIFLWDGFTPKTRGVFRAPEEKDLPPLHEAVKRGHEAWAKLLIQNGANVNEKDWQQQTPLHIAVIKENEALVRLLMSYRAKINVTNKDGWTPLYLSVMIGNAAILKIFIESGVEIKNKVFKQFLNENNLLHVVVMMGSEDYFSKKNLEKYSQQIRGDADALHAAATRGCEEVIELLIAHGAEINLQNQTLKRTPLHLAIINKKDAAAKLLIERGANVNIEDRYQQTPLRLAVDREKQDVNKELVRLLMEYGADIEKQNTFGLSALHIVVQKGFQDLVELFIEQNAKINLQDKKGDTTLHIAAAHGYEDIMRLLIAHGAKTNIQNNKGDTALHIAAAKGYESIIKLLIEHDVALNLQNKMGDTPLHVIQNSDDGVVELLIKNGANVNIRNRNGYTPFFELFFSSYINFSSLEKMLHAGADFKSTFLLRYTLAKNKWMSKENGQKKIKFWNAHEDRNLKMNYLIENYPNVALHILIKIFKETNEEEIAPESLMSSFVTNVWSFFNHLEQPQLLEVLRFFYANVLLYQWYQDISKDVRALLTKGSLGFSFMNPKLLEIETNRLVCLCQVNELFDSESVKQLQAKIEEQVYVFIHSCCVDLAKSFLLKKNQQESEPNNLNPVFVPESGFSSLRSSWVVDFQKLLLILPKEYLSSSKEAQRVYVFSRLQILMQFYTHLESIVALKGKLPSVNNDQHNKHKEFFVDKDILSSLFIENFTSWCRDR